MNGSPSTRTAILSMRVSHRPPELRIPRASERRTSAIGWAVTVLSLLTASLPAQEIDRVREYNVKVAYLYGFGRFIKWPPSSFPNPDAPFVVGVLGGNPFGDALDTLAAKKRIDNRPISVRFLDNLDDVAQCQILFVSRNVPAKDQEAVIRKTRGAHVLLVGESNGFTSRGGIINFLIVGGSVRFEINAEAAKQCGLTVEAQLLSLARSAPS